MESACDSNHESVLGVLLYDDLFSVKMTVVTLVHFLLYDRHLMMGPPLLIDLNPHFSYIEVLTYFSPARKIMLYLWNPVRAGDPISDLYSSSNSVQVPKNQICKICYLHLIKPK